MINRGSATPPWRQVAEIIKTRIESGELAPGTMLTQKSLSQEFEIAMGTARKVQLWLRDEGLVDIGQGWGTFVN